MRDLFLDLDLEEIYFSMILGVVEVSRKGRRKGDELLEKYRRLVEYAKSLEERLEGSKKEWEEEKRDLQEYINGLSSQLEELLFYARSIESQPLDIMMVLEKVSRKGKFGKIEGVVIGDRSERPVAFFPYESFLLTKEEYARIRPRQYLLVAKVLKNPRNPRLGFTQAVVGVYDQKPDLVKANVLSLLKDKDGKAKAEVAIGPGASMYIDYDPAKHKLEVGSVVELFGGKILGVHKPSELSRFEILEKPGVTWQDIGGLRRTKQEIFKSIIVPLLNPEDVGRAGTYPRKVLLYGPPGCGKTMIAKAIASSLPYCGFMKIEASEAESKWVGETPRYLRMAFQSCLEKLKRKEYKHMIFFLDEIDALALARDSPESKLHGGAVSTTGQLLTILDGFHGWHPNLRVIMVTNRPWALDPALLRPGRTDKVIEVPQPRSLEDFFDISSKYIRKEKTIFDKHILESYGSKQKAARGLAMELSKLLDSKEKIGTPLGYIEAREAVTGGLIMAIYGRAMENCIYDRTLFKLKSKKKLRKGEIAVWSSVPQEIKEEANKRFSSLKKIYSNWKEIGLEMDYLKRAYQELKQSHATNVLSYNLRMAEFKRSGGRDLGFYA
jgi:ATP-dependent 26S proteasome regulatory subunit